MTEQSRVFAHQINTLRMEMDDAERSIGIRLTLLEVTTEPLRQNFLGRLRWLFTGQ